MTYDTRECNACRYWNGGECTYHKTPRPKVVAVDLDGTILEFDGWKGHYWFGEPTRGAREALTELKRRGYVIVVWTTRKNVSDVARVLDSYGIPFDFINENPYQPPDCGRKIFADVYVDDRAVEFRGDWDYVLRRIEEVVD